MATFRILALLLSLLAASASHDAAAQSAAPMQTMPPIGRQLQEQLVQIRKEIADDPEQGVRRYGALLESMGPDARVLDRLTVLTLRGQQERLAKRLDRALEDLSAAIALSSAYATPFYFRAMCEAQGGNYDKAMEDIERALQLESRYAWPILLRARIHRGERRYTEARSDFEKFLTMEPRDRQARLEFASTLNEAGYRRHALTEIEKLVVKDTKNATLLVYKAAFLRGIGQFVQALEMTDRAIEAAGERDSVFLLRASIHLAQGNYEAVEVEAKHAFDVGLSQGVPHPHAAIYLQVARLRLGRSDPADLARRQELANAGPWPNALAEYLGDRIDESELLARSREMASRDPRDRIAEAQFFIGQRQAARGDIEKARRAFQAAVDTEASWKPEYELAGREFERLGKM